MDREHELHHYHIHWSGKAALDWEAHGSREEAEASAKQLVRAGETYAVEEHGLLCPRWCRRHQAEASSRLKESAA
jgi:hypothetical protein